MRRVPILILVPLGISRDPQYPQRPSQFRSPYLILCPALTFPNITFGAFCLLALLFLSVCSWASIGQCPGNCPSDWADLDSTMDIGIRTWVGERAARPPFKHRIQPFRLLGRRSLFLVALYRRPCSHTGISPETGRALYCGGCV